MLTIMLTGLTGLGCGEMITFLELATCTHVECHANGRGGGGMITFLALAHMLHATQDAGLGWGG